jgi:hypothetical protein
MGNQDIGTEDTGSEITNQAATKTYTQEEFDQHMARMKASLVKKYEKTYADLGDPDELRQLKTESERRRQEEQVKRGEFDRILQDLAAKKDQEIKKRDEIIKQYTIDVPLVSAAAQLRAVNAEQVKQLLKNSVRLGDTGEVEVLDDKGQVRYTDKGTPYQVNDLVGEFLKANPHFVAAGATTSNSRSSHGRGPEPLDVTKLDMRNPEHRKMFRQQTQGRKN